MTQHVQRSRLAMVRSRPDLTRRCSHCPCSLPVGPSMSTWPTTKLSCRFDGVDTFMSIGLHYSHYRKKMEQVSKILHAQIVSRTLVVGSWALSTAPCWYLVPVARQKPTGVMDVRQPTLVQQFRSRAPNAFVVLPMFYAVPPLCNGCQDLKSDSE